MVELVEVEDESFETKQPGPEENEEDYYTDTESEISTDDEEEIPDETLADRFLALKDIIPPTTRSFISNKVDTATSWAKSGLVFSGQTLWIIGTSALLLGVPWALAFAEEQQVQEMEQEMRAREMGADVLNSGNTAGQLNAQLNASEAKAAL